MAKYYGFKIICPKCGSDKCEVLINFGYEKDGAQCKSYGHHKGDIFVN